jgi:subtilisin family serine protease
VKPPYGICALESPIPQPIRHQWTSLTPARELSKHNRRLCSKAYDNQIKKGQSPLKSRHRQLCIFLPLLLSSGLASAQSKFTAEAKARLEYNLPKTPVFILLSSQPLSAAIARTSLSAARELTRNRTADPEPIAQRWRSQAFAEAAREIAPQQDRVEALLRASGATNVGRYTVLNMLTAEIPNWAIQDLENSPDVARVYLAKTRQAHIETSVPALGAPTFWNAGFTGTGQTIALVDTGVRTNHPAFAGRTIVNRIFLNYGKNTACFDDDPTSFEDKQGHGTHIAGILISQGSPGFTNSIGAARGLGTLYNIKAGFRPKSPCSSANAEADDRDLMDATQFAAEQGIRVVSCSFGGDVSPSDDDDLLALAFDQIADVNDTFIAVSAGNSGPNALTVASPAIGYNIVSVGNWASRGTMSTTSSRGPTGGGRFKPDIAAPGSNIISTAFNWDSGPTFITKSGTSMAAPHIAASAALLRSTGLVEALEAKAVLINTTGETGWAADRGWGYANLTIAQPQASFRDSRTVNPGSFNFYRLSAPGTLSATLTWNRHIFGERGAFTEIRVNNLDLYAYTLFSGASLTQSNSTLQNVEKITLNSSADVVLKVTSAASDKALEFYGIAASKSLSPATGPVLSVSCSQPSSGTLNVPFTGTCTINNTGDLPAFGTVLNIVGLEGANSWTRGTLQPGGSVAVNTSVTASIAGTRGFTVSASSVSYGENITAATTFSVNIPVAANGPGQPSNPSPANLAANVALSGSLSWTAAPGATSYDIYFGTTNPPPIFAANTTSVSLPYGPLTPDKQYFWEVVAKNGSGATASALWQFTSVSSSLLFVPIPPCRLVDTRNATGSLGGPALPAKQARTFPLSTHACVAGATPAAYSLNITVVPQGPLGFLTVWPAGQSQPVVSTLNALDGRIKANAAIVPAGTGGGVNLYATDSTHAIIDINGYFVQQSTPNGLAYYPLAPCRIADTRNSTPPVLAANTTRNFSVLGSSCGIPSSAQAYALNATVVPQTPGFGFLTLWPAGQTRPVVSTLNALTGTVTANAAIVPAGSSGQVSAFGTDNAHLILDITGYFAPPGSPGALTFRTLPPCRVLDTRLLPNAPLGGPILAANTSREIPVTSSNCQVPTSAQVYSLNATVVPPAAFGFLTMWPAGGTRPTVSTLNALDGALTSNAAIVSAAGPGGAISVLGSDAVHLILDISGYFTP